ncbi:MAG: transketolase [candidate division WOR-3 bacterium]|nr:transketolase [candidate division WOR-3 bacterium]
MRDYTIEELKEWANLMRGYNLVALCAAGSGHAGGTLSAMDITAALYLKVANLDPKNPFWEDRDRIIWSTGHKAPNLYLGLGAAGFYDIEDVVRLRKLYSPYQGHPHWPKLPGVEASTGSLGQGLSIGVGIALAAKLDDKNYRVYVLNGDGELQEGQIWEAVMEAGNWQLDNLCSIVDKNRLQIDGWVKDVQDIDPLKEKFEAFKWHVLECDGHSIKQIIVALEKGKNYKGKPTVIIAHTTKGKGVSFMENVAGWHGKAPNKQEMLKGIEELGLSNKIDVERLLKRAEDYQKQVDVILSKKIPKFSQDYFWNRQPNMKVQMEPTRFGFGKALEEHGNDPRIVCIGADISGSITISHFYEKHPERKNRWISAGIAEQSATALAAGLAKEGKIPVFGTYGVFAAGRNLDQLRTTVCYGNFNVLIAGAHGGVSVGPDGATHQALEDLFQICGLPNMHVSVPCDVLETKRATEHLLFNIKGPKYIRFAREATPVVTNEKTPYVWGVANIYRFRQEKENFIDAFDVYLATDYRTENEDITIIACGPEVPEAMRAAWILKKEFNIETRVVNMHTLKPLDKQTIIKCGLDTNVIITAEEHQVGALGNQVAGVIMQAKELYGKKIMMGMIGVKDRFGESGAPWELMWEFEVSGEHIAQKAKEIYDFIKKKN